LVLAIAGSGRDRERLEKLARELDAPVKFLGRVAHDDLPRLYGCADIYTMLCRNRWAGLEQEGFGIVFVEAAACGVPQIAGSSGGAAEAVAHGETGFVVAESEDVEAVAGYMETLLNDPDLRRRMGVASRERAITEFSYEMLAERLGNVFGVWS
jgi:phosphatidylinositol alpha-1,6-mannosyltransferase